MWFSTRRKSTSLTLSYSTQASGSGFNSQAWAVSTNTTTFTPVATFVSGTGAGFLTTTYAATGILSWTLTAANSTVLNAATVYVRLTVTGATTATGNDRLDNLQFVGC